MYKYQSALLCSHNNARHASLEDCYDNASVFKWRIYHAILKECNSLDGYDVRIPSYNTFFFTMSYKYDTVDAETGVVTVHLVYHTHANRYDFVID